MKYVKGVYGGQLDNEIAIYDAERYAEALMQRRGLGAEVAYFAGGLVGSLIDPSNVAAEVVGAAMFGGGAMLLGGTKRFASLANNLRRATHGRFGGTLNGIVGGAVGVATDSKFEEVSGQREYTTNDALLSLGGAIAFGAGFDLLRASLHAKFPRPKLDDDDHVGASTVQAIRDGVDADTNDIADGVKAAADEFDAGSLTPEAVSAIRSDQAGRAEASRHIENLDRFFADRREAARTPDSDFRFLDGETRMSVDRVETDTDIEAAGIRIAQGDIDAEDSIVGFLTRKGIIDGDSPSVRNVVRKWADETLDVTRNVVGPGHDPVRISPEIMRRVSQTERGGAGVALEFRDEPTRLTWARGALDKADPSEVKLLSQVEDTLSVRYGMDEKMMDDNLTRLNIEVDKATMQLRERPARESIARLRTMGIESPTLDFGRIALDKSMLRDFNDVTPRDLDARGVNTVDSLVSALYDREPGYGRLKEAMNAEVVRRNARRDAPQAPPPLTVKSPSPDNVNAHPSDLSRTRADVEALQILKSIDEMKDVPPEYKDHAHALNDEMKKLEDELAGCLNA